MTVITANPITSTRDRDSTSGGSDGRPVINRGLYQVVGFSPMTDCSASSCRYWDADCCFKIPVFAELQTTTPDYAPNQWDAAKNDQTSFLFQMPSYSTGNTNTMTIVLQKLAGSTWTNQAGLGDNTYGVFYGFYSLPIYYYKGYTIYWRYVLNAFGEGCYRIRVAYLSNGREGCMTSEPYQLREFSCARAHGTVRMDAKLYDGDIADINFDGVRQNLCGINWYDSIRFPAFFGYEKSDEEKRQIELTDGRILKMRDELVQNFELITSPLPKWFHDRFKAYGTMSDELRITDYNWNNSDYNINRKLIVRDGGYNPNYKIGSRLSTVTVKFKEGYQNVSRSLCCGTVYSGK